MTVLVTGARGHVGGAALTTLSHHYYRQNKASELSKHGIKRDLAVGTPREQVALGAADDVTAPVRAGTEGPRGCSLTWPRFSAAQYRPVLAAVQVGPPRGRLPAPACGASTWTPPALQRLHGSYREAGQRDQLKQSVHHFRGTPMSLAACRRFPPAALDLHPCTQHDLQRS
jgi:hypothetical protein